MCLTAVSALASAVGSKLLAPKAPKQVITDPAAEKAAADTAAANAANSKLASKNRSRALSALAVRTADSNVPALGAQPGKTTLGA